MSCEIKRCRQPEEYVYYKHLVCETHWKKHCNQKDDFNLKKELGVTEK